MKMESKGKSLNGNVSANMETQTNSIQMTPMDTQTQFESFHVMCQTDSIETKMAEKDSQTEHPSLDDISLDPDQAFLMSSGIFNQTMPAQEMKEVNSKESGMLVSSLII